MFDSLEGRSVARDRFNKESSLVVDDLGVGYHPALSDDPITASPFIPTTNPPKTHIIGRQTHSTQFYNNRKEMEKGLKMEFNVSVPTPSPVSATAGLGYESSDTSLETSSYIVISHVFTSVRQTLPADLKFAGTPAEGAYEFTYSPPEDEEGFFQPQAGAGAASGVVSATTATTSTTATTASGAGTRVSASAVARPVLSRLGSLGAGATDLREAFSSDTSPMALLSKGKFSKFALQYGLEYLAGLDYGMSAHLIIEINTRSTTLKRNLTAKGGVESTWATANASLVKSSLASDQGTTIKVYLESVGFIKYFPTIIIKGGDSVDVINKQWENLINSMKDLGEEFSKMASAVMYDDKGKDVKLPIVRRHYLPYNRIILTLLPFREARLVYKTYLAEQEGCLAMYVNLVEYSKLLRENLEWLLAMFRDSDSAAQYLVKLKESLLRLNVLDKLLNLCLLEDTMRGFNLKYEDHMAHLNTIASDISAQIVKINDLDLIHTAYPIQLCILDRNSDTSIPLAFKESAGKIFLIVQPGAHTTLYLRNLAGTGVLNHKDSIQICTMQDGEIRYLYPSNTLNVMYVKAATPKAIDGGGSMNWSIYSTATTPPVGSPEFSFKDTFALYCTYDGRSYKIASKTRPTLDASTDYPICAYKDDAGTLELRALPASGKTLKEELNRRNLVLTTAVSSSSPTNAGAKQSSPAPQPPRMPASALAYAPSIQLESPAGDGSTATVPAAAPGPAP